MARAAADIPDEVDDLRFTFDEEEILTAIIEESEFAITDSFSDEKERQKEILKCEALKKVLSIAKRHVKEMRERNLMIELKQIEFVALGAQHKNEVDILQKKNVEMIDKFKKDSELLRENFENKIERLKSKKNTMESEYKQKEDGYKRQIDELNVKLESPNPRTSKNEGSFVSVNSPKVFICKGDPNKLDKEEKLKEKIKALNLKITEAEKENQEKGKRIKKLEKQLSQNNELRQKYEETTKTLEGKNVEIFALTQTNSELTDTNGDLAQRNTELQTEYDTLTTKFLELTNQLNERRNGANNRSSAQIDPEEKAFKEGTS